MQLTPTEPYYFAGCLSSSTTSNRGCQVHHSLGSLVPTLYFASETAGALPPDTQATALLYPLEVSKPLAVAAALTQVDATDGSSLTASQLLTIAVQTPTAAAWRLAW